MLMSKKKKRQLRKRKEKDSYEVSMRRLTKFEGELRRHEFEIIQENIRLDKKRRKNYIV